jgi:hypothetical protein
LNGGFAPKVETNFRKTDVKRELSILSSCSPTTFADLEIRTCDRKIQLDDRLSQLRGGGVISWGDMEWQLCLWKMIS